MRYFDAMRVLVYFLFTGIYYYFFIYSLFLFFFISICLFIVSITVGRPTRGTTCYVKVFIFETVRDRANILDHMDHDLTP